MEKNILITGGTKGIGFAVAKSLVTAGYNVILTYGSDFHQAEKARMELHQAGKKSVMVVKADITEKKSIDILDDFLAEHNIRLFSVVFNAGITCRTPFESLTIDEWEQTFFANLHFPVFLLQRIVHRIDKGGNVLFTGSLMGEYAHSVSLAYGVSKSAVHALVKNLVKFMQPFSIRVNAVAPGFVDTDWQKNKPTEIRKNIENKIALGRFCSPDELAQVYKMIIENNYFNGEIIPVSGGYSYR